MTPTLNMAETVAPLVPTDVDLRGTAWMPYFGHLLRGSELNATVSDAGFRAAHNLWWAAWNEVPAASLPDDDRILTRMADLGTAVDQFLQVKAEALHGFIRCTDGRLYHEFLAGVAIHQWELLIEDNAVKERARNRMRTLRKHRRDVQETNTAVFAEQSTDVCGTSGILSDSPKGKNKKIHARSRATPRTPQGGLSFAKNGESGAAAPPGAINPKFLGHSLPCSCANCTRWVAQQQQQATA